MVDLSAREALTEKPELQLGGEDGNAFFIIGRACKIARRNEWTSQEVDTFRAKAMSGNYDNVLQTCMRYFDVS